MTATDTNQSKHRVWPWLAVPPALLLAQIGISSLTIHLATSNRTFATEPDYYKKALAWDSAAAERRHAADLSWIAQLDVSSQQSAAGTRTVRLLLRDRTGAALRDAQISAEVFHHARAAERETIVFQPSADGEYTTEARLPRTGLWEFRVTVHAQGENVNITQVLDVAAAQDGRP